MDGIVIDAWDKLVLECKSLRQDCDHYRIELDAALAEIARLTKLIPFRAHTKPVSANKKEIV